MHDLQVIGMAPRSLQPVGERLKLEIFDGVERLTGRMMRERITYGDEQLQKRQAENVGCHPRGVEIKRLNAVSIRHREDHGLTVRRASYQCAVATIERRGVFVLQSAHVLPEELSVLGAAFQPIHDLHELQILCLHDWIGDEA